MLISKLTVDYWVQDHIKEFKHIQGFRYFNVYGEGEEEKIALEINLVQLVNLFIRQRQKV